MAEILRVDHAGEMAAVAIYRGQRVVLGEAKGHERIAGQMFSGTLGLLRPSSQATKEKQEAERRDRSREYGDAENGA